MPCERSSFCCLSLFLFCFLLLTNFLLHYVFYAGTKIKDTDIDTDFLLLRQSINYLLPATTTVIAVTLQNASSKKKLLSEKNKSKRT